jgi:hypothetical protein
MCTYKMQEMLKVDASPDFVAELCVYILYYLVFSLGWFSIFLVTDITF